MSSFTPRLLLAVLAGFGLSVHGSTVKVDADSALTVHGKKDVTGLIFGENLGSGGTAGYEDVNASWFRHTSMQRLVKGVTESATQKEMPDVKSMKTKVSWSDKLNQIKLFHPRSDNPSCTTPLWLRPFGNPAKREQGARAWAELCAEYIRQSHELKKQKKAETKTYWEFGNEYMYHHYFKTPDTVMEENRCGPGINGAEFAKAYRQWVCHAATAIKRTVPDAVILAGSGDMITASRDWWGWRYWDKPFLDLCGSKIDYYATHWYCVDQDQIALEAGLIYSYNLKKNGKGLGTFVTEYGEVKGGVRSDRQGQWERSRYHATMIAAALRDPDKLVGLFQFIWNDPRYMPEFQVKDTINSDWLKLTRDFRGQRLLNVSTDQSVQSASVMNGSRIITLARNAGSKTNDVKFEFRAPAKVFFTSGKIGILEWCAETNDSASVENILNFRAPQKTVITSVQLKPGATTVIALDLDKTVVPSKQKSVTEFFADEFFIPANKEFAIDLPNVSPYALVRFAVDNRDAKWSDMYLQVNGHIYPVKTSLFRRRSKRFEVAVDPKILKKKNSLCLVTGGPNAGIRVITAAIELADIPMADSASSPAGRPVVLCLPEQEVTQGSEFGLTLRTAINGKKLTGKVEWSLPKRWEIVKDAGTSISVKVPDDMVPDTYPVVAKHESINISGQIRVFPMVHCSQAAESLKIDGDLNEWDGVSNNEIIAAKITAGNLAWEQGHTAMEQTGRKLKVAYNDMGIVFAAEFPKQIYEKGKRKGQLKDMWLDLFFDLGNERSRFKYDSNDHQFWVDLKPDGVGEIKQIIWYKSAPRHEVPNLQGAECRWQEKNDMVYVEGIIPRQAFHVLATNKDRVIGFDFRISDKIQWYSRGYESMVYRFPKTHSWGREQMLQDPAGWGFLKFE